MTQLDLPGGRLVHDAPESRVGSVAPARGSGTPGRGPTHARPRPVDAGWLPTAGACLSLVALALIAFVVNATVLSQVEHARSQDLAYAQLRSDLSNVTAPVGPTGVDGKLLATGTPLGYLDSPALGLTREVFFEGTTSGVLTKGPGHLRSTVLPGQNGVATLYGRAWAFGGPFNKLSDLAVGASIVVTTGQGAHVYRVTGLRGEGSPGPSAPDPGEGRLTLVSSTGSLPFAPTTVVYVDALRTSPSVPAPSQRLAASLLGKDEKPMAGDRSALPALFLLCQGLALAALAVTWATRRWGMRQAWLIGVPVLSLLSVLASREVLRLMPNLL